MDIAVRTIIFCIVFLVVFGVGGIWLQIFLSKKESKWAGLILPIITFAISVLVFLGNVFFSIGSVTRSDMVNGEIIETFTQFPSMIGPAVLIFLLYNIPTAVLLAIYAACRGKRKRQRVLEKMSVQDLE